MLKEGLGSPQLEDKGAGNMMFYKKGEKSEAPQSSTARKEDVISRFGSVSDAGSPLRLNSPLPASKGPLCMASIVILIAGLLWCPH